MTFQFLDRKNECTSLFINNEITNYSDNLIFDNTWSFHPILKDRNINYASIFALGKSLEECCPEDLKLDLKNIKQKHQALLRSLKEAKVMINDHCLEKIFPESFLTQYFELKNKITDHVIQKYPKPINYDFFSDLLYLLHKIEYSRLNLDFDFLNKKIYDPKALLLKKKINKTEPYIRYNMFGTITGRLSTKKNSFPILTLNKEFRDVIKPKNNWFVELDYNSAELRTFLALNGKNQPDKDIHCWHQQLYEDFFGESLSRADVKQKFFAWFYGGKSRFSSIPIINQSYDKESLLQKFWDGKKVTNIFNREIEADHHHAFNAIIQSTTSDLFLRKAIEINKILENKKSFISFMIHDNMVIDFDKEEKYLLKNIVDCFRNTALGKFKTNLKIGPVLSQMKEL